MSFDINWDTLRNDADISNSIREFLHDQLQTLTLPSYISNLQVVDFSLGDIPPEVTIRHIGDPFPDFYTPEDDDSTEEAGSSVSNEPKESEDDDDEQDDDDEEDYMEDKLSTIAEGESMIYTETPIQQHSEQMQDSASSHQPPVLRSKESFQSVFHPYGVNGILGSANATTSGTGTETPTHILNPNLLSSRAVPKIATKSETKASNVGVNDIQFIVEINYKGDMHIDLLVTLLVNYPSPKFISLPIKLHVTDLVVHSIATIAYLNKSVYLSFLCDVNDDFDISGLASNASTPGGNIVDYYFHDPHSKERIDIIKKIRIESEIGEVENNVLRNVGKVEKFLMEQLRGILREEIAWPSWICIDMNDSDEESI
ncbi:MDM12 [Candida metapsilosis]|uniref:Mitochondrial distribution and morphology protein 12 n=1 Tax=Candida metapsilosis TaxID=273372 RepID=A0A8H7Z9T8_9ASCO|nr:MDM12 [Candida metapsilosis]